MMNGEMNGLEAFSTQNKGVDLTRRKTKWETGFFDTTWVYWFGLLYCAKIKRHFHFSFAGGSFFFSK
jgi:hypothetical protein